MFKTLINITVIIVLLSSCSKTLDDMPGYSENINGFIVNWRDNVSVKKKKVIKDILNDMQFVKGGTFLMGATQEQDDYARENERPAHYVKIDDYYIGRNEITIKQIEVLTESVFDDYEQQKGAPKYTWNDWNNLIALIRDYCQLNLDFPTEAQWEYAARGGSKGLGFIYSGGNNIEEVEFSVNELGLYGMSRCHSEWCKDAYSPYSNNPLVINPCCSQGVGHVVRGGNLNSIEELNKPYNNYLTRYSFAGSYKDYRSCRVSSRSYCEDRSSYLGVYILCRLVINLNTE